MESLGNSGFEPNQAEADCGNLRSLEAGRIGPKETFGAIFWQFGAFQPAIEIAFWNLWETAVLGQILARSRLEPDLGTLARVSRLPEPFGTRLCQFGNVGLF